MKIVVLKETAAHELRVAATPETVKKLIALGAEVVVETGAGQGASFSDAAYTNAGATIGTSAGAQVVLAVQAPAADKVPEGATLIALQNPYANPEKLKELAARNITALALEFVPRISRAQSMDVLSSQSNLAGYRAVLEAAHLFNRGFPMMMTAAGTVPPAKVLVMGAGVAGLQAIATAKRLGAVVSATDVRLAAKEQVESLGGKFVMVDDEEAKQAETSGGYAKEMSDSYKAKQAALIAETIKTQDIVITTALIPGRKAPQLVTAEMLASMKPGSIVIDIAAEQGGNVALTKAGEVVEVGGVKIFGPINLPSRIAADASSLFARNVVAYLTPLVNKESKQLNINFEDEIVKATTLTHGGAVVHANFAPKTEGASA